MMRRLSLAAMAIVLGCVLAACGGSDGGGSPSVSNTTLAPLADSSGQETSGIPAACKLLTDDEVTAVLGEHGPGEHDYVYGGCVWPSSDGGPIAEGVHVTVLEDAEFDSVAHVGEPIDDLGVDATYDDIYRNLWFACGDKHCGVVTVFDPPDAARRAAVELAKLVQGRVGR